MSIYLVKYVNILCQVSLDTIFSLLQVLFLYRCYPLILQILLVSCMPFPAGAEDAPSLQEAMLL